MTPDEQRIALYALRARLEALENSLLWAMVIFAGLVFFFDL